MSIPADGNWLQGIISTATSVWQAFIVPSALALWVVYQRQTSRSDNRRTSEADRMANYATRLETRLAVEDADKQLLHAELAEEKRDKLRGWYLARWWERRCHEDRHLLGNMRQRGPLPDDWRFPDLPGLEDPD